MGPQQRKRGGRAKLATHGGMGRRRRKRKGDMWCGSVWEGTRWREKKKRKNTLWTLYPFQQLENVVLPNFFLTSEARARKECFIKEATTRAETLPNGPLAIACFVRASVFKCDINGTSPF